MSLSVASSDVRCVAKGCQFTGINSNNKSAVGVCAKCGGYEHFACSKTKPEIRDEINKGTMKYYCSTCFMKNPSSIAFDKSPLIPLGPLKESPQKSIDYHPPVVTVSGVPEPTTPKVIHLCKKCSFETESHGQLLIHEQNNHPGVNCNECKEYFEDETALNNHKTTDHISAKHRCNQCEKEFTTKSILEKHVEEEHAVDKYIKCNKCDEQFATNDLEAHIQSKHSTRCLLCNLTFTEMEKYSDHLKNDHAPVCHICDCRFESTTKLEEHTRNSHTTKIKFVCEECDETTSTKEELNKHIEERHVKSSESDQVSRTSSEQQSHVESQHEMKCIHCDYNAESTGDLNHHLSEKHSIQCPMCSLKCKDIVELSSHLTNNHISSCQICNKYFGSLSELQKHNDEKHTFKCTTCGEIFDAPEKVKAHYDKEHQCKCKFCDQIFVDEETIKKHIDTDHSYECEKCEFKGNTTRIMEEHILEKHITQDKNNMYSCDECPFQCKKKETFWKHFKDNHDKGPNEQGKVDEGKRSKEVVDEESTTKEELRRLRNNFERLESLFQDSLDEVNTLKAEYEAKLNEANDKYRQVKAENEELREKVDILFKLGRSYINKKEACKEITENEKTKNNKEEDEVTECLDNEEETVEELQAWTQNKMRGFKRVSPSADPILKSNASSSQQSSGSLGSRRAHLPRPPAPAAPSSPSQTSLGTPPPPTLRSERKQYCHYYVNQGTCFYEDKTGNKCKFVHEKAPLCRNGLSCTRSKCMYSHPNIGGRGNTTFLDRAKGYQPQMMNMWPMMNPWMNPNILRQTNPWTLNRNQGNPGDY